MIKEEWPLVERLRLAASHMQALDHRHAKAVLEAANLIERVKNEIME